MAAIILVIVLGSSLWVAFDANEFEKKGTPVSGDTPLRWFFACLFLWIIAFPYYLSKRSHVTRI